MIKNLAVLLFLCLNSYAFCQTDSTYVAKSDSKWQVEIAPYLWFSSLKGDVSFLDRTVPVDVEFKDILDQLSFGVLLHGEVNKDRWTIITDLVYLKMKEEGTIRNSAQTTNIDVSQLILEFGGGYRLIQLEDYFSLDGLLGVRYFDLDPQIAINQRTVVDKSLDFVDPYVGLRFRSINGKWINRAGFDVGGFGIGSEVSWKINLMVGYQISKPLSVYLGYKGYNVDYEEDDSSFKYNVYTGGFLIGVDFKL